MKGLSTILGRPYSRAARMFRRCGKSRIRIGVVRGWTAVLASRCWLQHPDEGAIVTIVLIGVDSTSRSEDAIAFARDLAPATDADFVVATVVPNAPTSEAHETVRRMSGLLVGIEPDRIRTGVVASRSPAKGLYELAEAESAGLAIVGSTHTGLIGRVRAGSTGERLLAGAPCPVAVVPQGYRTQRDHALRRIGVAYDGSSESRVALQAGIAAARALRAPLQVITVISPDIYGAPALMTGPGWVVALDDVEQQIRKNLEEAVATVPADVEARGVVLNGRPWRELADRSAELDLLFVGARGYGPLQAVLLGSTSGPLLREAHCPVIALPRTVSSPALFGDEAVTAA
jgi:nucleotide-binding universal stress UspA family protein